jgi:DNA-binding PadR family transcriptional regulator
MSRLSPDNTILGLLAVEPAHGYQLLDFFRAPDELGRVWSLSTSQLYAILKRLEQQGLITGQEIESADAPARTEYRLTPAGRQQFTVWLSEPHPLSSMRRLRTEFLSRLYIARLLDMPVTPIIARQRASCQQHREHLIQQHSQAESGIGFLALDLLTAELNIVMQWLGRCESLLSDDQALP